MKVFMSNHKELIRLNIKTLELEKNLSGLTSQNQKLTATLRKIQEITSDI